MSDSMNPIFDADELDWLAFCFVSGELADDDRSAFELRLASDQAAREAVARAVELQQAIALAETSVVAPSRPVFQGRRQAAWPLRMAWMSVGAAAALALAAVWIQRDAVSTWWSPPTADRRELAEAWSQTRETVREIVQAERYEAPLPLAADAPADDGLPSWIAAAVFSQPAGVEPSDDGPATHDES